MSATSRVMLITGASRGIGAATAIMAAGRGWSVGVTYRSKQHEAEGVVESCRALGADDIAFHCEVADEASVVSMFDECQAVLGSPTSFVNNAGSSSRYRVSRT